MRVTEQGTLYVFAPLRGFPLQEALALRQDDL